MKVRDILEVGEPGLTVFPNLVREYEWPLCHVMSNSYDEACLRKSFQKNLEKREKAHNRALKRDTDGRGYALLPMGILQFITVLNGNVTSFDELLDMEVERVTSRGSQGGFSSVVVYVKDIFVIE